LHYCYSNLSIYLASQILWTSIQKITQLISHLILPKRNKSSFKLNESLILCYRIAIRTIERAISLRCSCWSRCPIQWSRKRRIRSDIYICIARFMSLLNLHGCPRERFRNRILVHLCISIKGIIAGRYFFRQQDNIREC